MQFTVRAFDCEFGKSATSATSAVGRIEHDVFVVLLSGARFDGVRVVIPAASTGTDQHGPFAIIEEREVSVGNGRVGRVEPEYDELSERLGLGSGCIISVEKPGSRARAERL